MPILFLGLGLASLWPPFSPGLALGIGIAYALLFTNPYPHQTRYWVPKLLASAVVGLGAAMNLATVVQTGMSGFIFTLLTISGTLGLGMVLARLFKVEKNLCLLISVGTAICGGSAIAAVAPAIGAKPNEISVSMAIVFLLNAIALFLFPFLGHQFGLTENQFGLWAALSIHDTSSVVGAASTYGVQSLQIATITKLARALWIVPVTLILGAWHGSSKTRRKFPWFILGFLAAAALVTYVPTLQETGLLVAFLAKRILALTLFLIGSLISREAIRTVGPRPLLFAVTLWAIVATISLLSV